jgi:hypothetical protein
MYDESMRAAAAILCRDFLHHKICDARSTMQTIKNSPKGCPLKQRLRAGVTVEQLKTGKRPTAEDILMYGYGNSTLLNYHFDL